MNEHDAATSMFGAMSGCEKSIPVSMSPTRAPSPWLTAYEPDGVALIARISHWQTPSGSGPSSAGTEKSDEHAACSAGTVFSAVAREVCRVGSVAPPPNHASRATPVTAPETRSVCWNDGFEDVTVAIPSLFSPTIVPPAF